MIEKEPNQPFERYLISLGERSTDYAYTLDTLYENLNYFKECWNNNLSTYKALEWLSFELDKENTDEKKA